MNSDSNRSLQRIVHRKWLKFRLRPIHVYCFHQVSDVFDPETTWECDWLQTENFKRIILELAKNSTFLSLEEAYEHVRRDFFRRENYSVLTFDDGCSSMRDIIPWLAAQNIPVTLFVNPGVMKGEACREKAMRLLNDEELRGVIERYPSIVSIASHGYTHGDCAAISLEKFEKEVIRAEEALAKYKNKIPYFAYPYGRHIEDTDKCLRRLNLVPVYCDGQVNYNDKKAFHREVINNSILK